MNRQEMAALFARAAGVEKVTIAGVEMEIIEMSFGVRAGLDKYSDDGVQAMREMLKASCYRPGSVERILDDELIDMLPQGEVMRLFGIVKRLNGMDAKPTLAPDPEVEQSVHEPSEAEKNA